MPPGRARDRVARVIPVDQTTFGSEGNCFSACVASILELPISEVPQFMTVAGLNDGDGLAWWDRFTTWCRDRGVEFAYFGDVNGPPPPGYSIKSGTSPRCATRKHAVVVLDGELAHDPRGDDRRGVLDLLDYITVAWAR